MRKIFAFLVVTVDGYYKGPNQEFDWPVADEEFNEFGVEQLDEADTLLFGRVTYELMAAYWPTPAAEQDDPRVASRMNSFSKVVVSRTLDKPEWANTLVIKDVEELARLKEQPGKDIAILGSSDLTVNLIRAGLVDEVRIMVNPVVLGAGKSLFRCEDRGIARPTVRADLLQTLAKHRGSLRFTLRDLTDEQRRVRAATRRGRDLPGLLRSTVRSGGAVTLRPGPPRLGPR